LEIDAQLELTPGECSAQAGEDWGVDGPTGKGADFKQGIDLYNDMEHHSMVLPSFGGAYP